MKKVLLVSGHTDLNDSVANTTLLDEVKQQLPQTQIVKLDKEYPQFAINVKQEQERLQAADIVVLQFPLFWFSAPSLLHRWLEEVLVHGFAWGTGSVLEGKKVILSVTTGAPQEYYLNGTALGNTLDTLLVFLKETIAMCGMSYEGFVLTGNLSYALRGDDKELARMKTDAKEHARKLVEKIKALD